MKVVSLILGILAVACLAGGGWFFYMFTKLMSMGGGSSALAVPLSTLAGSGLVAFAVFTIGAVLASKSQTIVREVHVE